MWCEPCGEIEWIGYNGEKLENLVGHQVTGVRSWMLRR